jgi:hypothetical protein
MRGAGKRGQHKPHNPTGNPDVFQDVNVLAGDQVPGILDRLQAQEDARVRLEQTVGEMSQKLDQIAQFLSARSKKNSNFEEASSSPAAQEDAPIKGSEADDDGANEDQGENSSSDSSDDDDVEDQTPLSWKQLRLQI